MVEVLFDVPGQPGQTTTRAIGCLSRPFHYRLEGDEFTGRCRAQIHRRSFIAASSLISLIEDSPKTIHEVARLRGGIVQLPRGTVVTILPMGVDTGRLLRLRGAITGTLASTERGEGGRSPFAGEALGDAYNRYRSELLSLLPDNSTIRSEVEALCPAFSEAPPGSRHDLFGHDAFTGKAAALLGQLAGWIDGLIEEAQMQMNATAYAEARIKDERSVGFRPPSGA